MARTSNGNFLFLLRCALADNPHSFIANVAPFVGAFSEALHIRTGLMVSVMLTGPIPSDNGRIGVRR